MNINKSELTKLVFSDWRFFIGFGFGSGLLPYIPGTWGTLITIPLAILMSHLPMVLYIGILLILFILGVTLSQVLSDKLGEHDYGGVNIDEVVGFLCVMLPFSCTWQHFLLGFILFRFFDILKPFPIGWLDKNVHGGFGMMIDDIAAACMSILTMYALTIWVN